MEYRTLGESGLVVSALGLGTNNFGTRLTEHESKDVVGAAIDLGITLFDTSDLYGSGKSEEFLGRAVGHHRSDVLIATKVGYPTGADSSGGGLSRNWIREAADNSLRRLGTDWIDVYWLHIPDRHTPIAETLETLADLVKEGKVRYAATSNFAAWELVDTDWVARTNEWPRPVAAQYVWSLLERELEPNILPAIQRLGIGLVAARPLAYGFLTGKFVTGTSAKASRLPASKRATDILTSSNFEQLERLTAFAAAHGHTILELAFGYLLTELILSAVLVSASTPAQLKQDAGAIGWRLSSDERANLLDMLPPMPTGQPKT